MHAPLDGCHEDSNDQKMPSTDVVEQGHENSRKTLVPGLVTCAAIHFGETAFVHAGLHQWHKDFELE
jgi:hypothetical protein